MRARTNIHVAIRYGRAGYRIFPCGIDKRPLVTSWPTEATSDEARITEWWKAHPEALVGLPMKPHDLLAFDADRHRDGEDGVAHFRALYAEHEPLPAHPIVLTPNGGEHHILKQPAAKKIGNRKLGKGLETRGYKDDNGGGYIIAAGSGLPDGRGWRLFKGSPSLLNSSPPEPPAWLADLLHEQREEPPQTNSGGAAGKREEAYAAKALDNLARDLAAMAPESGRNNALNTAALKLGGMVARGWTGRATVEGRLFDACVANGLVKDTGANAVRGTIRSGLEAGLKQPHADLPNRERKSSEPVECKVAELAALSRLEYGRRRKDEAKKLGITLAVLDYEVAGLRARQKPARNFLPHWEVQPWSEEVNGVALLDDLRWQFARYVVLPAHADVALALWVVHTWVFECFDVTPYLCITSPTRRCGKTVLMTLLYWLSCRGKKTDSMSKPAIYRSVDREKPTLVLDEVGWVVDPKDERQGILCGGFERNGYAEVCEGEGAAITTRLFSTYCPKAFGLIGKLTATLTDRSICIPMRRKLRTERVERLRRQDNEQFAQLRQRCLRWANDNAGTLAQAPPLEFDGLNDRALDFWEPLLTIADRAGGAWPQLARTAALALSGEGDGEDVRVELLRDIRAAFGDDDVIRSVDLIAKLTGDPECPWAEYNHGKPISQRQLARLLGGFHIISTNVRPPAPLPQGKGYRRIDFEEAWAVYCSGQNLSSADSALSKRPNVPMPMESAQVDDFASVPSPCWDGSKNADLSNNHAGWDAGTDRNRESGGERDFATTSPSPNTIGGRPSRVPYDPGPIPECLLRVPRDGNGQPARVPSDYDAVLEEQAAQGEPPEVCAQCRAAEPGPLLYAQVVEGMVPLHRECVGFWLKDHPQPKGRPIPLVHNTEIARGTRTLR